MTSVSFSTVTWKPLLATPDRGFLLIELPIKRANATGSKRNYKFGRSYEPPLSEPPLK